LAQFGESLEEQRRQYQDFAERGSSRENAYPVAVISQQIIGPEDFAERVLSEDRHFQLHGEKAGLKVAERILRDVIAFLDGEDISGLDEKRRKALARHMARYLIRRRTTLPLRSIGVLLGVKAAAVALAIRRLEKLFKDGGAPHGVELLLEPARLVSRAESRDFANKDRRDFASGSSDA